ncbi:hypothetical protein ANCDUO_01397 [Ancylostoma duodenale]|uniref:Uncharacterized protein n=1 Tax=Ancylostoma duodenale TaxID=51022 RepID=A0A0C2H9G2_9BILA|nr:hypothetical protein ANCDUO_01397 [Ancylostoma duodenale]
MNITVEGRRPRGRPKTRWLDSIEDDMRFLKLSVDDVYDRRKWRNRTKNANPRRWETGQVEEELCLVQARFAKLVRYWSDAETLSEVFIADVAESRNASHSA